jgi:hypothetical protein
MVSGFINDKVSRSKCQLILFLRCQSDLQPNIFEAASRSCIWLSGFHPQPAQPRVSVRTTWCRPGLTGIMCPVQISTQVVGSLLALEALDEDEEIRLYINSPGQQRCPLLVPSWSPRCSWCST